MKNYRVQMISEKEDRDYGILDEETVKAMLKNYEYDELLEMWFSPKGKKAYVVTEA